MGKSQPLICHECWDTEVNHYNPCAHAMQVFDAGRTQGERNAAADMAYVLEAATEVIRQWHGPEAWDIYYDNAPEMAPIRAWIKEWSKSKDQ